MKLVIPRTVFLCMAATCTARGQWVKLSSTHAANSQASGGNITVSTTPSVVNLALVPGGRSAVSPAITISYAVNLTLLTNFSLYASFATTSALTDSGGDVIPSSAVYGQCPSGNPTSFTPFTQSGPFASGSSLLVYQTSSLATLLATRSQACTLFIDLTNLPQLPAGSYSGNLVIQAQAL